MIHRVRKSFIKITMTMLTLVLLVPVVALNIITSAMTYNQTHQLLDQIAQTEVYILEPRDPAPDEREPTENQNVGVGKPIQHTTTVTTAPAVTTETATVSTAVPTEAVPDVPVQAITTAPPIHQDPEEPDFTQGTPPAQGTRETIPVFTRPEQPSEPVWDQTHPAYTQPTPIWTRPPREEFENDTNYDEPWYGRGAVQSPIRNFSIAQLFSLSAAADPAQTTAVTATSARTVTTTAASAPGSRRVITQKVLDFDRKRPEPPMENVSSNTIDHFVVYLNQTGAVTDIHGTDQYDTESCTELITEINASREYDGYCGSLQFVKKDYTDGAVVVFSDRQSDITMMKNMLFASIAVFLLMEVIVFILTRILTKRAMRPMQVSLEKQQQFISDAGHELKTPLTIISANADILADEIGDNKWLSYIKSQAERMRILVQEMMDLMKISGTPQHLAQSRFNLGSLVENVALPFECQAFEQKKTFHIELEPDVEFFGNTEQIRRMVGIFIDNAFKYSNENGTIQVQLKTENGKKVLKIYNTGQGIEKGEEEKIFERFYRSDSSRSRQTGGYGLGLAIAKSIADQHQIRIQVVTEPGQWISFNLFL